MAQAQPRRFRDTGRLERALLLVRVPNGARSVATVKGGYNNAKGPESMASSLLHDDVAEARKASAAFAATVRDVLEGWAHKRCNDRRPHRATYTRAPRNARKRAATRLRSAPTAGQSTPGIPAYRGAGGHEIFLRPPETRPAARVKLVIFLSCAELVNGFMSLAESRRAETRWVGTRAPEGRPAGRAGRRRPRRCRLSGGDYWRARAARASGGRSTCQRRGVGR
jgi:hypothetical protein